ncbi:MAG: hypothetical protein LBH07_03150, partial [Treponema sp.]|nr:hypothetical protein [Treponema sp.]
MLLSIIRPLVRGLWKLPGLSACPLLALGIILGIFPAYGFRPECIPLLFFAFFLFFTNLQDLSNLFTGLHSDSYRDQGLLFTLSSAAAFAFSLWISLYYAPPVDMDLSTKGVKTIFLQEGNLHIRVYNQTDLTENPSTVPTPPSARPLLILLPPVAGSFIVTDDVCSSLRDRGFTVLTFSRLNFDSPSFNQDGMPVRLFLPGLYRLGNAILRGLSDVAANAGGRELEEKRMQDTIFILDELNSNKTLMDLLEDTDRNNVFLAGYGAGGAALTVLAGNNNFAAQYGNIRGIITIEAPLLSSLEGDRLPSPSPPPKDPVSAFYRQSREYAESFVPRKITHAGVIPSPVLPVLFIVSDHVIQERKGRYETILRAFGAARNMALLAAVPGAGPLDYSGSPRYYPVLSILFRGAAPHLDNHTVKQNNWPELTAS